MKFIVFVIVFVIEAWLMYSIWQYVELCIWPRKLRKYSREANLDSEGLRADGIWGTCRKYELGEKIPLFNHIVGCFKVPRVPWFRASFGIGGIIWGGLYAALFFMPDTWGYVEDGDWRTYRNYFSGMTGIISGFFIVFCTLTRIEQTYTSLLTARIEKLVLTTKVKFAQMDQSEAELEADRLANRLEELKQQHQGIPFYDLTEDEEVELTATKRLVDERHGLVNLARGSTQ